MYDPSVGRWLEQDPEGFAAGDANLYRYAGNRPTVETDPSGLEIPGQGPEITLPRPSDAERTRLHNEYRARELNVPGFPPIMIYIDGGTVAQRRVVFERLREAIIQLDRAAKALENLWREIGEYYARDANLDDLRNERDSRRLAAFVRNIISARDILKRTRMMFFQINDTPVGGQGNSEPWAYVRRFGRTIYLNPRFFLGRPLDQPNAVPPRAAELERSQVHTLVWELGRFLAGITDMGGTQPLDNQIGTWTRIIQLLAKDYDDLLGLQLQNRRDEFQLAPPGERCDGPPPTLEIRPLNPDLEPGPRMENPR